MIDDIPFPSIKIASESKGEQCDCLLLLVVLTPLLTTNMPFS